MAIKAMPIVSQQVYLSDLLNGVYPDTNHGKTCKGMSKEVAELEGDCPKDELAWVVVRQATEQDNMRRAGRVAKRTVQWAGDEVSETRDDNLREQWAYQVWLCLCDTGNISDRDGKPVFQFKDAGKGYTQLDMGFKNFLDAYGSLPSAVTSAMRRAVLNINPDWDWVMETDESGEE